MKILNEIYMYQFQISCCHLRSVLYYTGMYLFINRPAEKIVTSTSKEPVEPESHPAPPMHKHGNQNFDDTIAMLNEQNQAARLTSRSADETDLDITQRDESYEKRPVSNATCKILQGKYLWNLVLQ